jgi:hypothetical protein
LAGSTVVDSKQGSCVAFYNTTCHTRVMNKWKFLQYIAVLVFMAISIWIFAPYVKDLGRLYDYRNNLNYWWILFALLTQIAQYGADGFLLADYLAS